MKISIIYKAVLLVSKIDRVWFVFNIIYPIVAGSIPLLSIYITKEFIDQLIIMIENKQQSSLILQLLLIQVLLVLFSKFIEDIKNYFNLKAEITVGHSIEKRVLTKVTNIKFDHFDNPNFYNHLSRIQGNYGGRFLAPVTEFVELVKNLISMTGIFVYLITVHWVFIFFVIIPIIPLFIAKYKYGINGYMLGVLYTPQRRDALYTSKLLTERATAKEIRIYGLKDYLIDRWSKKYLESSKKSLQLAKKQLRIEYYLEVFNCINYIFMIYFIISLIKKSSLTIGGYVTLIQAIQQIQSYLNTATFNATNIMQQSLYLNDYFEFMNFTEDKVDLSTVENKNFPNSLSREISFKQVNFSYNNSKKVIDNITLNINAGEKVAIVGENGSGKTTLIKCLLGLYEISSGDILFDGVSIKSINKKDLTENVTALFQDFQKYSYTVKENIAFGNINSMDNMELISKNAKLTGADIIINKLDQGYNTYLNRDLYNGEDLSGGQWQKIALSRAMIRNSQIIILDEPTSALDPFSENKIYEQFNSLTSDKTVIYISHRMSTTRFADRILVLKDGKIIEDGSFEKLMSKQGEFFQMYQIQNPMHSSSYSLLKA